MSHDIFISYSSKDSLIADEICKYLEVNNIHCWIAPRNIDTGVSFAKAIIEGIKNCHTLLLVFTENSNESEQVLREVDRAVHFEKKILILKIFSGKYSDGLDYYLCTTDCVDATRGNYQQYFSAALRMIKPKMSVSAISQVNKVNVKNNEMSHYEGPTVSTQVKDKKKLILMISLFLIIGGGIYYKQFSGNEQDFSRKFNPEIQSEKKEVAYKASTETYQILPADLFKRSNESLFDEKLISKLSFDDLKRLSKQIKGQEGNFLKNSRSGIKAISLSDMAQNNLDLIDHFIISKISKNLPQRSWKKICLGLTSKRMIQKEEFKVLQVLEEFLIKSFATNAEKLYKTKIQNKSDECSEKDFISIEVEKKSLVDQDVDIRMFIHKDEALEDKTENIDNQKVKIEFIDSLGASPRMLIFFSNEDKVIQVVKRYIALLWGN